MAKIEKKVWVSEKLQLTGRRRVAASSVLSLPLFAATRARKEGEYRKNGLTIVSENKFGDTITISAPRTLFVSPDMGVFLATVACAQRAGFRALVDAETGEMEPFVKTEFPLSWLYELTGMSSQGQGRYQLLTSLEVLGQVGLTIKFSNKSVFERQSGKFGLSLTIFGVCSSRVARDGRSLVRLYPSPFLVPQALSLG